MKKLIVSVVIVIALAVVAGQAFADDCCAKPATAATTTGAPATQSLPPAENLLKLTGTVVSIAPNGAALVDTSTAKIYVVAPAVPTTDGTTPQSPFKVGDRIQVAGVLQALSVQPAANTAVAAVYVCPMHPEVQSSKPGRCPKCGMNLVKKTQ